jgi:hypothetical protein
MENDVAIQPDGSSYELSVEARKNSGFEVITKLIFPNRG